MKKQTIAIILVIAVLVIAIIGVVIATNNKNNNNEAKIETVGQMKSMMKTINSNLKEQLPQLEIEEIDISDRELVKAYTGLQSNENVEKLVVSEPLMNAQAYSAVVLKVKPGADIEKMKQEIIDNIDMGKWICVSAEKLYVTNSDNIIFLVMSDEEWAKLVYEEFKKYVDNKIGKELEKAGNEENIELPPEMFVVQ